MKFVLAIVLLFACAFQDSFAFLTNGGRFVGRIAGVKFAPLHMAAPTNGEWGLKSITQEKLFDSVKDAITKQLEDVERDSIKLESNLRDDFDADSVDVVAMLITLETNFHELFSETKTKVPTEKLGTLNTVKDVYDLMYDVLQEVEAKTK